MPLWLVVILLGIIEGITEFIPISSTGHLLIAQDFWLPRQSDLFNVVIQSGAVLAVLPLFKDRLAMLTRLHEPRSRDLLSKIIVAFLITCAGGYLMEKRHFKLPEAVYPVAFALLIGGVLFIAVEWMLRGRPMTTEVSWLVAVVIGAAQLIAAAFPGASRSGVTILFALMLGLGRVPATEFSFLVGIPTMLAASALKIFKSLHHPEPGVIPENWAMVALGTILAAAVSFVAVKWLLRYVQTHTFAGFGIYRIVVGLALLAYIFFIGGHP